MSIPSSRLIPIVVASTAVLAAVAFTAFAFPSVQASAPAPAVSRAPAPAPAPAPSPAATPAATPAAVTRVGSATANEVPLAQLGVALLVLAGLGGAAIGFVKLSKKSAWRRRASKRSVEVLDVLHLGGKRSVAVTRVYDRVLVLGLGDGPMALLTELKEDEAGVAPAAAAAAPGASTGAHAFRAFLAAMTSRRAAHAAVDASPAFAEAREPAAVSDDAPTIIPAPRPPITSPKPAAPIPAPSAPRRRTVAFTGITSAADLEALRREEIL